VLVDGERAVLRYDEAGAFAGGVGEVDAWLALLDADGRRPRALRWIGGATATLADRAMEHEDIAPLRWYAQQLPRMPELNLLQGGHAPRRDREGAQKLWRWAAALALVAVLAAFAQVLLERGQLAARRDAQRAEMEQLLRAAMPGVGRVVDPKAQLAAEYARGASGAGQGALPMLARVAPLIGGWGLYTLDAI
jgi:general secretion pathway protein L